MSLSSVFNSERIESGLQKILLIGYSKILKKEPSEKIKNFFTNFGYLALAELIGSVIGFPIKILVGRFLGPEEYGKYALILNLTQFFIIPMLLGFSTAVLQYLPSHPEKKSRIMTIVFACTIVTTGFFTLFFLLTPHIWTSLFNVSRDIFIWTIAYSIIYVFYYVLEAFQRGSHRFFLLFWITILNSSVLLITFLIFLFGFHQETYQTFITANIVAFASSCVVFLYFFFFKDKPDYTPDAQLTKKILSYSGLATLGGITGFIIGNTDRLFLNHYASLYWVGVYAAYTNASTFLIGRFFQLFLNVYFPTVAKEKDKSAVIHSVQRMYRFAVIPIFIVSVLSIWGVMLLFGNAFPILPHFILLFSFNNCLMVLYQLQMWLFNAQGNRGMKTTSRILIFNAVLNIILYFFLIQWWGVVGALFSATITYTIFILYYRNRVRHFIARGYFNEA
ncbi:MAG: oligosaccharide flippase family protein [Candidatus Kerfeldbacteria bacterium]|nr:oligosaccharide flippase family protein [Candidatus Kerfeldbacteria bacterium]